MMNEKGDDPDFDVIKYLAFYTNKNGNGEKFDKLKLDHINTNYDSYERCYEEVLKSLSQKVKSC